MKMPDFLVIGLAKSGTTSMNRYLDAHPQIAMSALKEPHFFECGESDQPRTSWTFSFHPYPQVVSTMAAYQALFASLPEDTLHGEASTSNIHARACSRIYHYLPNGRFICILRQPVDRAYSQFAMRHMRGSESETDFRTAYNDSPRRWERRFSGTAVPYAQYQASWYLARLLDWFGRFSRTQVHIGLYDDLKADTAAYMRSVYTFLNVDPSFTPDISQVHNPGYWPRSTRLHHFLRIRHWGKDLLKTVLPASVIKAGSQWLHQVNRTPLAPLDPDLRRELMLPQRDDILRLQDLLDRDLSCWLA